MLSNPVADMKRTPGAEASGVQARQRRSGQAGADVLEDAAHDRAEEDEGDDHDNRDQGQKQTVLDERLAFLILAAETSEKSADELKHSFAIPPFLGDLPAQRMRAIASPE